jgi:hypothetical protein
MGQGNRPRNGSRYGPVPLQDVRGNFPFVSCHHPDQSMMARNFPAKGKQAALRGGLQLQYGYDER